MILKTSYSIDKIIEILNEEIDPVPSNLWTKIKKTTPVCGRVDSSGFEFRNNIYHMFSVRAVGVFRSNHNETKLEIEFNKPPFPYNVYGNMFLRYKTDEKIILSFLEEWLVK